MYLLILRIVFNIIESYKKVIQKYQVEVLTFISAMTEITLVFILGSVST